MSFHAAAYVMTPGFHHAGHGPARVQARGWVTLVPAAASYPCGGILLQWVQHEQHAVQVSVGGSTLTVSMWAFPHAAQRSIGGWIATMFCGAALSGCVWACAITDQ
ncbi:hypothetical protein DD235_02250 [Corticimicrobacter populi]|uniref:Uncharacterized protein n=1 Tax=Corticimicrobacter populi TaxID=2175229 RepID=A0A2V1K169_9BURK|nr:hypothetical protein DD235_02250 [Corticimicrobacter populi]